MTSQENLINTGIMAGAISEYPREKKKKKSPGGLGTAGNLACLSKRFYHLPLTGILPLRRGYKLALMNEMK